MKKKSRWLRRFVFIGIALAGIAVWSSGPRIKAGSHLVLDLAGEFDAGKPSGPVAQILNPSRSFTDLSATLRRARVDGRLDGVILRIGGFESGWGHADEIRAALEEIKAAGKTVTAFLTGEISGANVELYLASVANKVYAPAAGDFMLNGLAANYLFLGGVWEKLDMTVQVEQRREYKSFGDTISRRSMSAAHREMAESLLGSINDHFVSTLASARNLTEREVRATIERAPSTGTALVDAGIIDGVKTYREVLSTLGGGSPVATVDAETYGRVTDGSLGLGGGAEIAVVHIVGSIVNGPSPRRGNATGSATIAKSLRSLSDDDGVKAIVLRVESPGGSPAASDEIWSAVQHVATQKPVVASMGNVAGSGGYYVVAGADQIFAQPSTFTGSIGVVLFKPDASGLLDRLGIGTETVALGRYSRLMDMTKRFDEQELSLIRRNVDRIYALFLDRVAVGREMSTHDADQVGGGRVWSGSQAAENGLIDHLGGLFDAVKAAASAANIHEPDRVQLVHYPKDERLFEEILSSLSLHAQSSRLDTPWNFGQRVEKLVTGHYLQPGISTSMTALPHIE